MTHPFEKDDATYRVLVNTENQHSLWPAWLDAPGGWNTQYEGSRESCLEYVETHWTDLRPARDL
ncbi:MbtH family protein [Streptomyces sp. NBC_00829]|uniref:MbtH family protein n=1 Tax=Streptomyces sp. NBC_00829 TaxID=2903679 RepID=UPI002F90D99B|nr:MbtH family protein [Streptomyces sp. NBC_00829]